MSEHRILNTKHKNAESGPPGEELDRGRVPKVERIQDRESGSGQSGRGEDLGGGQGWHMQS
ncbi:MAG TPA: hypothetical protein DCS85_06610 [Verrucomicrobiales bacterium]|nr:hypothetical protein [Verrucomicrobiales bacterium]